MKNICKSVFIYGLYSINHFLTGLLSISTQEENHRIVSHESLSLQYDDPIYSFDTINPKNFHKVNTELELSLCLCGVMCYLRALNLVF